MPSAWKTYEGRALGSDVRLSYPPEWALHIDPLVGMLIFIDGPLPTPELMRTKN